MSSASKASAPGPAAWRRLLLPSLVLAGWLAFLGHQAFWYANPDVLLGPQVLVAPVVVEGELLERPPRVVVKRVWRGDSALLGQTLPLAHAPLPPSAATKDYVLPVRRVGAEYHIVPAPPDRHTRPIYPATDQVRRQLEGWLRAPAATDP